jgi:hypothetical protein
MPQLFVDMDGVLADFDAHYKAVFGVLADKALDNVDWKAVRGVKDFYLHIPPMPDMRDLWSYIAQLRPIVLTGVPASVPEAPANKIGWVRRHLSDQVEVRCCLSKEKCLHAAPGDVLIDDWEKYRGLWLAKGGRWITHTSAESSIRQLQELGLGL